MQIIINQNAVSLTDSYEIFVNKDKFFAESEPLKKSAKINISNFENSILMRIAKQNFGIRANYLIQDLRSGEIYFFEEINNIKLIMKCQISEDVYEIFGHNDNKYSIFKNQKQIAYWSKNNLIFGERDSYEIISNDNEDSLILSAFCICVDNSKNNFQNELSFFNFDIGFKGNLLKKFDEDWKPS